MYENQAHYEASYIWESRFQDEYLQANQSYPTSSNINLFGDSGEVRGAVNNKIA